ncbi:diguanylate cyclase [Robbsia sp. Bb-Pol-6]|uniref:diguanylate cyclase n=1 Tax=Robbsia betulipollinis TaxID=2981849 RepID=A0ABT3ZH94_9BURK|nr:diguanylate cyclase [Robbsia betulipollinis]MCY0385792.1 diguanylate cyclase [Robbsia betulipollinis]
MFHLKNRRVPTIDRNAVDLSNWVAENLEQLETSDVAELLVFGNCVTPAPESHAPEKKRTWKRPLHLRGWSSWGFLARAFRKGCAETIRRPRLALTFTAALCIVMALLCALSLWQQRLDTSRHAIETSSNLLTIVQKDIERNVELYDLSLRAAADGTQDPTIMQLPARLRNQILFDASARASNLAGMFVLDRSGKLIIADKTDTPLARNDAGRDFFEVHRVSPAAGLYISQPTVIDGTSGFPAIILSRRITARDGSFAGVVGIPIDLRYFQQLFSGLKLQSKGITALVNEKGVFLTRLPLHSRAVAGKSLISQPLMQQLSATGEGSFTRTAAVDKIERLYVFRHLPRLGMIVIVAPSTADVFAAWRSRMVVIGVLMAVFSITLQFVSLLLFVELRKRVTGEAAMRALAQTDSLTGLATRRVFDDVLHREKDIAHCTGRPLTVVFIDVDHFKTFNDTYGHLVGDEALQRIARILSEGVRSTRDLAARYGGEEFVLVLGDTPNTVAQAVAERIRRAVDACRIPHALAPSGNVTISLGVVTYDGTAPVDIHELLARADRSLYEAKLRGRNRVFAEPMTQEA